MTQLGLLDRQAPAASPRAPDGVRRAVRAGRGVDAEIIDWCRAHIGRTATELELWHAVSQVRTCLPDTTRRRRDALEAQGLIQTEDAGPGRFRVVGVRP